MVMPAAEAATGAGAAVIPPVPARALLSFVPAAVNKQRFPLNHAVIGQSSVAIASRPRRVAQAAALVAAAAAAMIAVVAAAVATNIVRSYESGRPALSRPAFSLVLNYWIHTETDSLSVR